MSDEPGRTAEMVAKEDAVSSPDRSIVPETVTHAVGTETEFIGPKNKTDPGVIDLTSDNQESDLQKAIAESLRDTQQAPPSGATGAGILGGQVTREEQDISRALEQSLEENKAGTKRKRGDLWFVDPLNPHERKRQGSWPVGLKNVGNTCWFSAVIQSLFHLPVFRQLVLNFVCPPDNEKDNTVERRHLRFMQELRQLFALMIASQRKYVDPSRSVEILKEAFSTGDTTTVDSQQDVSEFQHKLLDWLEEAFKSEESRAASPVQEASSTSTKAAGSASSLRPSSNPMVQLFYGEFQAEGINEGKSFSNKERFGQFPLQVDGFQDVHKSLDGATARGEIETVSSDVTSKSGQEIWFTRLPPVLTFELSRFQFNQRLGKPEKIHNRLDFPELIFMDRYMEGNKYVTREKREQMKKLKEELVRLQSRLDRFINYGSGPKRFPLQDVLKYTLEFAESGSPAKRPTDYNLSDVEMESPSSQHSVKMDSPEPVASVSAPQTPAPSSPQTRPSQCSPAPSDITRDELQVLQNCLQRWRTEVEQNVKELQCSINQYEDVMQAMYKDGSLQKHPYRLHAVLVHEGQAASGHYWAYVFNAQMEKWLKFNDITVTETQWDEIQRESVGGFHNTSAYCLMYVDGSRVDMFDEDDLGPGLLGQLPLDLQKFVQEDNDRFEQEIEEWNAEMLRKRPQPGSDADVQIVGEQARSDLLARPSKGTSTPHPLITEHARLVYTDIQKLIGQAVSSDCFDDGADAAQNALLEVYKGEIDRLNGLARSFREDYPKTDPRLKHMVVYLLTNNADHNSVIKRVLLEQFLYVMQLEKGHSSRKEDIHSKVQFELNDLRRNQPEDGEKAYLAWHEAYNTFHKMTHLFILGLEAFHKENYLEALPYLCLTCDMNSDLLWDSKQAKSCKGINSQIPQYYRRQCLLHINESATQEFECSDDPEEALQMMMQFVLPCLSALLLTKSQEDQSAVEEVRNRWCMFLSQTLPEPKSAKLQDFLSKLFETPVESRTTYRPPMPRDGDMMPLWKRYEITMDTALKLGFLEAALASK